MENIINKTEQKIIEQFKELIGNEQFSINQNVVWRQNNEYHIFDLILEYDKTPYAIVEIKKTPITPDKFEKDIRKRMHILSCPYGILTDGKIFYLYSAGQIGASFYNDYDSLSNALNEQIEKEKNNIVNSSSIKNILSQKIHISKDLAIVNRAKKIGFTEDDEIFLWKQIMRDATAQKKKLLSRYTSLNSVVKILTTGHLRMNGLAAMNDTTETSFYEHLVYKKKKEDMEIPNDIYISSCSINKDDLTMWRLYGDNGRGACIVFEVDYESKSDFIISPVCYVNSSVKNTLKAIRELVQQNVRLMYENIYSHCFKPEKYEIENEIRILYLNKDKNVETQWSVSPDYSIINPFIEIPLNKQKTLKLVKIILGPTCPNKKLNKIQITRLLKETNVYHDENAKCVQSKINCYR